jgi:hypothetical protein
MPLAFFILANKHQTFYGGVLRHTISDAAKFVVHIFPTIIYAELETGIHNTMTTWPGCEVKASRFQLVQSLWRKIQCLGLSK